MYSCYFLLCQAHFTASEVQFVLNKKPELKENKNSRKLYLELRKNFGVKAQYSELVMLCKNCRYLWLYYFASIHSCSIHILFADVFSGHLTAIPVYLQSRWSLKTLLRPLSHSHQPHSCLSSTSQPRGIISQS